MRTLAPRSRQFFPAGLRAMVTGTDGTNIVLYFVDTRDNKKLKDLSRDLPHGIRCARAYTAVAAFTPLAHLC